MTEDEVIAALDRIDEADPEMAHGAADDILLTTVPPAVAAAYQRLVERCRWWAHA